MSKRLILILALAFVVGITCAAYAEVQNVKVSGDLLLRGITRNDFTLDDSDKYDVGGLTADARLRVDADLTDNVAVTIRLLSEKSWGKTLSGKTLVKRDIIGATGDWIDGVDLGSLTSSDEVDIDLAYVTLKEFLYSPITLTLGRQELRFGNALIIGDVDTNRLAVNLWVPPDLSLRKAFDAIRATLNYDPMVVDLIYAKVHENDVWWLRYAGREDEDIDLYGINARYDLKDLGFKGTAEVYWFDRVNRYDLDTTGKQDTCNTIGGLISGEIIKDLTGSFEYAYQFGNSTVTGSNLKRRAWALQTGLNYALPVKSLKKYAPNLGLVYTYLSGDKNSSDTKYGNWDPMFEDQVPNAIPNALFPASNMQVINAKGSIKPIEDLTLSAVYGYYRLAKVLGGLSGTYGDYTMNPDKKGFGHAVDVTATYDYTEDVQFGLTFGYFNPGKAFMSNNQESASQLVGSMKVTF